VAQRSAQLGKGRADITRDPKVRVAAHRCSRWDHLIIRTLQHLIAELEAKKRDF
jgi:hypothetical protein